MKLIHGECLEEMKKLESGSVDLILIDPPYGTIKGLGGEIEKYKLLSNSTWDETLDTKKMFNECGRVLRNNGKLILFSQEPYTSKTITEAIPLLPFSYRMVWEKDHFANCLVVNKAPVSYFEDVLVFSKVHPKHDFEGFHPLRPYFEKVFNFIGLSKKRLMEKVGQGADHTFRFGSSQFSLCIKETYNKLTTEFNLCNMNNFIEFNKLKEIDSQYRKDLINTMNSKYPSIFNLWEGNKLKSNILNYKKDYGGLHPTQKPVALLKDLIQTYSNEGDTVLDFTMGSGSTGIACKDTNRNFIGIELDLKYFDIATKRLNDALHENDGVKKHEEKD